MKDLFNVSASPVRDGHMSSIIAVIYSLNYRDPLTPSLNARSRWSQACTPYFLVSHLHVDPTQKFVRYKAPAGPPGGTYDSRNPKGTKPSFPSYDTPLIMMISCISISYGSPSPIRRLRSLHGSHQWRMVPMCILRVGFMRFM